MRVHLKRPSDGAQLYVISAHLESGVKPANEAQRLLQIHGPCVGASGTLSEGGMREWLLESAADGTPTLFCLDANSSPGRPEEQTVWRALRGTSGVLSVWDAYYTPAGALREREACGLALSSAAEPSPFPVTTNKLRGPLSRQKAKVGEHMLHTIDHIFWAGEGIHNLRHAWGPITYTRPAEAHPHLLPSLEVPSDHLPVVIEFELRPNAMRQPTGLDNSSRVSRTLSSGARRSEHSTKARSNGAASFASANDETAGDDMKGVASGGGGQASEAVAARAMEDSSADETAGDDMSGVASGGGGQALKAPEAPTAVREEVRVRVRGGGVQASKEPEDAPAAVGEEVAEAAKAPEEAPAAVGEEVAEAAQVVIGDVSGEAEADHTKRAVPAEQGPVDWKSKLSAEEYRVLREKGTEAEGTGEYDKFYPKTGYFVCRGCGNPLFSAGAKFKSGCGWPSFDRCYAGSINVQPDLSHGERRIELVCVECGGHLGHLFTGEKLTKMDQRHCVNSMSMKFINDAPPSWLAEKGEGKVATDSVDKLLAVTAVQTDGKLKSVRPTSDLVLDDPRLRSAWEEARAKPRGWSVFSYAANSKTKIECRASGSEGFDELRKALVESEVSIREISPRGSCPAAGHVHIPGMCMCISQRILS